MVIKNKVRHIEIFCFNVPTKLCLVDLMMIIIVVVLSSRAWLGRSEDLSFIMGNLLGVVRFISKAKWQALGSHSWDRDVFILF